MTDKFHTTIISYIPKFVLPSPVFLDGKDPNLLEKLESVFPKLLASGEIKQFIYGEGNGSPKIVLVIDDAKSHQESMLQWSENKPEEWFNVSAKTRDGRYVFILCPNVEKSIERHKMHYQIHSGFPLPDDTNFSVYFIPLTFVSLKAVQTCKWINKAFRQKSIEVALLDTNDMDSNPQNININKFLKIGNLPVVRDDKKLCDQLFESKNSPLRGN